MKKYLCHIVLFFCIIQQLYSQADGVVAFNIPARNSLKFNKQFINPTFSFVREQNKYISINNNRQWAQFDNAPETYLFSYSGRFRENVGAGLSLFQQNYGILNTFGGVANFAYNAVLDRYSNLTFGLNLGFYKSGINQGAVVTNVTDASIDNYPSSSVITINPGINYGLDFLDFGVSVNNLVAYNFTNSKMIEDNPEQSLQAHLLYTGYVNTRGFFDESKFTGLISSDFKKDNTVLSGMVMLMVPKGIWAQAGYNSLYAVSAGIGLNITNQIAVEYNYEKGAGGFSAFGNSHDITIAYKFNNNYRYDYSGDDDEDGLLLSSNKKRRTFKTRKKPSKKKTTNTPKSKTPKVVAAEVPSEKEESTPVAVKDENSAVQVAEDTKAKEIEAARLQAEEQEQARIVEQARAKEIEAARLQAEEQEQARIVEQARVQAAEEAKAKEEEAARLEAVELEKARIAEQARVQAAAEAKAKEIEAARLEAARLQSEKQEQARLAEQERAQVEEEAIVKDESEEQIEEVLLDEVLIEFKKSRDDALKSQALLFNQLNEKVDSKQEDLDNLKEENDLSEKGIVSQPKVFKSVSAENAEIESLKLKIDNSISFGKAKITEIEALYEERLKKVKDKNDAVNIEYVNTIEALKTDISKAQQKKQKLILALTDIKLATDFERRRRIKRADYDNEEDRYNKDRTALERIKKFTEPSATVLTIEDFDFGEPLSNIQIVNGINNVDEGYYLVIAVHKDVAKRDEFLKKAIQSGEINVDFFYDLNTSKYYIYSEKYESIGEAKSAMDRSKGSKPYNSNMSMVKIQN
ncbi:type IX secretion system membrane protein PorP/SprF [Algibacter amylolyticus]|uniref:Type IX secretion system membrane protein PorP/SprF n=1 Tax=Algibacter amylolyticus TaxID=1608400 RepID=A0A5M7BEC1_9FLAO|nr:PorP/SprF family type IX secretion system membrane protein [Algibacter amylolyticus]KAA5825741.1 type IX secretion system membrane protein PorP/SprF [Algibacter amylolyticus]MBB5268024.1 type IX secretion system PorP/SprF family membrane protein [Algibacter amylolyticus]TSJ80039.1 type IX secretion system membrane protein PorP/SprF [Algibacter amylolyticus]